MPSQWRHQRFEGQSTARWWAVKQLKQSLHCVTLSRRAEGGSSRKTAQSRSRCGRLHCGQSSDFPAAEMSARWRTRVFVTRPACPPAPPAVPASIPVGGKAARSTALNSRSRPVKKRTRVSHGTASRCSLVARSQSRLVVESSLATIRCTRKQSQSTGQSSCCREVRNSQEAVQHPFLGQRLALNWRE